MEIQLTKGFFSATDATELIAKLIKAKIEFHAQKISNTDLEEDIEYRENRIKDLQRELDKLRSFVFPGTGKMRVETMINIYWEVE